jgi:uridine kinase
MSEKFRNPIVIGVCGGTASGKTTFAEKIRDMLLAGGHKTVMISQDSFYRNLDAEQLKQVDQNKYNFDHPEAIDFALMNKVLDDLINASDTNDTANFYLAPSADKTADVLPSAKNANFYLAPSADKTADVLPSAKNANFYLAPSADKIADVLPSAKNAKTVEIPIYNFQTHQRSKETEKVVAGDSIIVEGLFIFNDPLLRSKMHIKVFVDVDGDTRLSRRIRRDICDRGRDITSVLDQYEKYVKPGYIHFIEPSKRFADMIVPYGGHNAIAVDMITRYLTK